MPGTETVSTEPVKTTAPAGTQTTSAQTAETDPSKMSFRDYDKWREAGSKPAASENKTEVTEPSETVTDPVEDNGDGGETQEAGTQAADKNAGKKKGGFQRRINSLTKEKSDAQRERDYWKAEALKAKQAQEAAQVNAQPPQAAAQDVNDAEPDPEKFQSVRDYLKAQTQWAVKQEQKKNERAQQTTEAETAFKAKINEFDSKVKDFKKVATDFDEVAAEFGEAFPAGIPFRMLDVIAESENGPQIMYELAKDHAEFERVSKLPPLAFAREIGRREAKIQTPGQTQTKIKTTNAPAPMTPVKGASAVNAKDPSTMTFKEFDAWRSAGGGR